LNNLWLGTFLQNNKPEGLICNLKEIGDQTAKRKRNWDCFENNKTEIGLFWSLILDSLAIKIKFGLICKKQNKIGKKGNFGKNVKWNS